MNKILTTLSALLKGQLKGHTGQWAEDTIVRKLFLRSKKQGVYVDLGAYHPFIHSNTAYLYLKGWKGINVDANKHSIPLFDKARPNDINLNLALIPSNQYGNNSQTVELYLPNEGSDETGRNGIAATASLNSSIASERNLKRTEKVNAIDIYTLFQKYTSSLLKIIAPAFILQLNQRKQNTCRTMDTILSLEWARLQFLPLEKVID